MSAERDAGLAAMQSGDIETAIQQLELATQQNPNDYQASMYLGAAYGQAKRHTDAVAILTTAVQIEPANAQARYNLGIAMEQGGWIEQANQAYQQALTLQPDYTKAQEALGRTQAMLTPQPTVDPMNMPTTAMTPQSYAPNVMQPQQPPAYTPPAPQGYGQPAPYGQQPQQGYGSPPSPYGAPPSPYGNSATTYPQHVATYPAAAQYEPDSFSIKDALIDWKDVLFAPRAFWQRQANSDGLAAPSAMILTYTGVMFLLMGLATALFNSAGQPAMIVGVFIGLAIVGVLFVLLMFIFTFIFGGLIHLVGKLFGNNASYAGSFRVMTYSMAPYFLLVTLATVISAPFNPSSPLSGGSFSRASRQNQQIPRDASGQPDLAALMDQSSRESSGASVLTSIAGLVSMVWVVIAMGMGIAHVQRISTGGAVGTVVLGFIIPIIAIAIVLTMIFAAFIMALLGAAAGAG